MRYEEPQMEITLIEAEDIITSSTEDPDKGWSDWWTPEF